MELEDSSVSYRAPADDTLGRIGESRYADYAWIFLLWSLPLFLGALQDVPFVDDWVYAWPVEQLLGGHGFKILEYSSSFNLVQAVWGCLFCAFGGFSFALLRLSTWTLAGCGLCGFYALLRELSVSRVKALLGTATLAVNPVFFNLAFTFMTDVPFLSLSIGSVFCAVKGLATNKTRWFVGAAILAALASGIRLVGVGIPAAMALLLLCRRRQFQISWGTLLLAILPPVLTACFCFWWAAHRTSPVDITGLNGIPKTRLDLLKYVVPSLPRTSVGGLLFVAGAVGLQILPITVSMLDRKLMRRSLPALFFLAALWAAAFALNVKFSIPLCAGSNWEWNGFNTSMELLDGGPLLPNPIFLWGIFVMALFSTCAGIACVKNNVLTNARTFLLWLVMANVGLILALWLFHDRYALVLLPLGVALLLSSGIEVRVKPFMATLALFAAIAWMNEYNTLQFNKALWTAVDDLRARNIPPDEIDGGYVVNGWLQYAHPENAPKDRNGARIVPGLTTLTGELPCRISNQPETGYEVLSTVHYHRVLAQDGTLYVLRKSDL